MTIISVSTAEKQNERLTARNLEVAVRAVREDGFVILEDVIAHDHLDILLEKMTVDLETLLTARTLPCNFVRNHVQQDPPPLAPYVFRDVVANPYVVQVSTAVLGAGFFNSFYSGNTNLPGSTEQPVHADMGQLWKGLSVAHPASHLVVNVVLEDVTERNGSVELWSGTHLDTTVALGDDIKVPLGALEARRRECPPVRGNLPKGAVLIRDMRLWHRGTPNVSDRPRQMIAMIHNVSWLERHPPLRFGTGCEPAFENCGFEPNVVFTDEAIDYIFRNRPFDYSEES
jgi:hypothetical protein